MTYRRLTKQQFEALHEDFGHFLASQSIDADQWAQMKETSPNLVERQLDAFSDLVWEEVLRKATFLDHFSEDGLFSFHAGQKSLRLIGVRATSAVDLSNSDGWAWLEVNWQDDQVNFYHAQKAYATNRSTELFSLIERGAVVSDGTYFWALEKILLQGKSLI